MSVWIMLHPATAKSDQQIYDVSSHFHSKRGGSSVNLTDRLIATAQNLAPDLKRKVDLARTQEARQAAHKEQLLVSLVAERKFHHLDLLTSCDSLLITPSGQSKPMMPLRLCGPQRIRASRGGSVVRACQTSRPCTQASSLLYKTQQTQSILDIKTTHNMTSFAEMTFIARTVIHPQCFPPSYQMRR